MNATETFLLKTFKGRGNLTFRELAEEMRLKDSSLSETAIRKRISRLLGTGKIVSVSKGVYALTQKAPYQPVADDFIKKLNGIFRQAYPEIKSCIWSSAFFYDFMVHQPASYFYVFETEPDMVETAFNLFKDHNLKAWLQPDAEVIQLYVSDQENPVIVKSLVSRAPLLNSEKGHLPSLEKMLVDVKVDRDLFNFISGAEIDNIWKQSLKKHGLSWPRLLAYAGRRGKRDEIKQWAVEKGFAPNND